MQVFIGIDPAAERGFNWCCELGRAGPLAVPGLLLGPRPVNVAQFRRFVEQVGKCWLTCDSFAVHRKQQAQLDMCRAKRRSSQRLLAAVRPRRFTC